MKRLAIALTVATLAAAGCGGSSAKTSKPSGTTTPSSTAVGSGSVTAAAAKARAEKVLLVKSDFPSNWVETPADNNPTDNSDTQIYACLGLRAKPVIDWSGSDFDAPGIKAPSIASVSSNGTVFATADGAKALFAGYKSPKLAGCLQTLFGSDTSGGNGGVTYGTPEVTSFAVPAHGDGSLGVAFQVPITSQGTTFTLKAEIVEYRSGDLMAGALFLTSGADVPAAVRTSSIDKVGSRVDHL